jgi:hypothetical protein
MIDSGSNGNSVAECKKAVKVASSAVDAKVSNG